MKAYSYLLFLAQIVATLYGLYNEFAPVTYPMSELLPKGMGLAIALIGSTMTFVLLHVEKERGERQKQLDEAALLRDLGNRLTASVPMHERDFYALWPEQVKRARNNVDVTHLGLTPPRLNGDPSERTLFCDLKKIYKASGAAIRRVERYSEAKKDWIEKLIVDFEGLSNVSLGVYEDPFDTTMPAALSVCRVDDRYAWLIAVAEHESTSNHRDLLLTGKDSVDLIKGYFQDRLWAKSIKVVERGKLNANWEAELRK